MINVLIWNEFLHEKQQSAVAEIYPRGIHECIGESLSRCGDISVRLAALDDEQQGLSAEALAQTDVLIWWGHMAHERVSDESVRRVVARVNGGMGLIALHSAHHSRVFRALMGTTCNLKWRHGDRERVWCAAPSHPIARGVPEHFELAQEEMYGEPFDIPEPDETVFISWFSGGEVFRSGVTYRRGAGRIFYFQPGHEEYPTYHDENVLKVIENAVRWARPADRADRTIPCTSPAPPEMR